MTVPLTSTVIVLGPSAADSNACTGTTLPINLSHRECRPFQLWKLTQSRAQLSSAGRAHKQIAFRSRRQPSPDRDRHEPLPLSP